MVLQTIGMFWEVFVMKQTFNEGAVIRQLSLVGIVGNILLSAFKLFAGIVGQSGAMVSDAVHSMSDVAATFIAFLGVRLSRKEADEGHPYGHDRLECVAAIFLGLILALTGLGIGKVGLEKILAGNYDALAVPGAIALVAALVSIVVKEAMYWYTRHFAKLLNSPAFLADAWHHRSDALSSVGSLIGIGGAMLGWPVLDPAASLVICLCILKVAYDILKDAIQKMLDTSCGADFETGLRAFILDQSREITIDSLRTRTFGSKVYVDLELAIDGQKTVSAAHALAQQIHDALENRYPEIKHVMIHVNPAQEQA